VLAGLARPCLACPFLALANQGLANLQSSDKQRGHPRLL